MVKNKAPPLEAGPEIAGGLASFGGFDPTCQFADIIFPKFLDEIHPAQLLVHAGEHLDGSPGALLGITAQRRDGLAEVPLKGLGVGVWGRG
jgi:hypothetical protein